MSDILKGEGNQFINQQQYEQALSKYEESLAIFRYISSDSNQNLKDDDLHYHLEVPDPKYINTMNSHMVKLYLNISLCLTKLHRK